MEDDQRNKVSVQTDSVSLSEVLSEQVVSGELITKLLKEMVPTYGMRTGKTIQID